MWIAVLVATKGSCGLKTSMSVLIDCCRNYFVALDCNQRLV
jgi:hypothetical protein